MAIIRIKTKNADYLVELGSHTKQKPTIRTDLYRKADAFILEGNTINLLQKAYPKIFAEAKNKNKTIWLADAPSKRENAKWVIERLPGPALGVCLGALIVSKLDKQKMITRRKFLGLLYKAGILFVTAGVVKEMTPGKLASWVAVIKKGQMPKLLLDLGITTSDIVKTAAVEGRNVLIAQIAESFIAPHLSEKLGKRPKIYVWMGAGHISLPKLIEKPSYRRKVFKKFSPLTKFFDTSRPGDCFELYYEGGKLCHKRHENVINSNQQTKRYKSGVIRGKRISRRKFFGKAIKKLIRI